MMRLCSDRHPSPGTFLGVRPSLCLTVGLTYLWGKNWKSERVGLLAGGILATSLGFFALSQYATLNMALTFWTTGTLLAGSGLLVERSVHRARRLTYMAALGIAGGILTKGDRPRLLPASGASGLRCIGVKDDADPAG